MKDSTLVKVWSSFAEILEYPSPRLADSARLCASLLPIGSRESSMIDSFASYVENHSLEHLQELYTRTFDLEPSCFPYVGYHVFGESYKRGDFMARLKARYTELGFEVGNELPDHLPVMLRFLSLIGGRESVDLTKLCLSPAIEKMVSALGGKQNPYLEALQALEAKVKAVERLTPAFGSA